MTPAGFRAMWAALAPIGRDPETGGYRRPGWSAPEGECRALFVDWARARGLPHEQDGNGNLWATWAPSGVDGAGPAVVTGSHFDSVPQGGAYDGPLGIVAAFLALDLLRERGVRPRRPVRIAAFAEEEGSRFGVACLGSRLLTGALDPAAALALTDPDGVRLADVVGDPARVGPDPGRLAGIGSYVELHIEQGRDLVHRDAPVGVGTGIWPHGRWRIDLAGEANHAGTTRPADRRDPMLTYAFAVLAAGKEARLRGGHATIGRLSVTPNATNAIPARVTGWLDARAPDPSTLDALVAAVTGKVTDRAVRDRTTATVTAESVSPPVAFDPELVGTVRAALAGAGTAAPELATAAGHDAGVLAAHVPAVMLFVRNPTGVSHSPAEHATEADCLAGVAALAATLERLACR